MKLKVILIEIKALLINDAAIMELIDVAGLSTCKMPG